MICKKEWQQYFCSITGYLAIIVFLLLNGLILFVFPESNLLDFGYATINSFFVTAPFILLFFIPTITMRSLAEEYKTGTFELLKTLPITPNNIVIGKFFGALLIVIAALFPTIIYAVSIQSLSNVGGIDIGATIGSYVGLILLAAVYTAIGICASSFTNNTVVAFIAGAFICFILFNGFAAISKLPVLKAGADYYIETLGIDAHYKSISRGVVDLRDLIYFLGIITLFLSITQRNIAKR